MWYGKEPSVSLLGPPVTCPECNHRQHPTIISGTVDAVALVKCNECGRKGTPHEFGRMTEQQRREKRREYKRQWARDNRERNREKNREKQRRYRECHRDEINARRRKRRQEDSEYRERINARERERRASDPEYCQHRRELSKKYREEKRERMGDVLYRREHRMYQRERKKRKALANQASKPVAKCGVCGGSFIPARHDQHRCFDCIAAKPKWSCHQHHRYYEQHGCR